AEPIDPALAEAAQPPAAADGAMGSGAADAPIAPSPALDEPAPDAPADAEPINLSGAALVDPIPDPRSPIDWSRAEALLFVAPEPLEGMALARALGLDAAQWAARLPEFRRHFAGRGIRVQEIDDRFQLVSAPEAGPLLEGFFGGQGSSRLSAAALEVLAIVAYRQPLTRAQIEAIRGVDSSGVLRALLARELVQEVGRAETVGRPILYGTTPQFLQLFGLERLADLPEIDIPEPPPLDPAAD
ncbi:MAG TPA: SMC-Scp complex subunit ScpB, partial [Herpetosiphonaceae bacterium]